MEASGDALTIMFLEGLHYIRIGLDLEIGIPYDQVVAADIPTNFPSLKE